MTPEMEDQTGVSNASKPEFEGNNGLNLCSSGDMPNVGRDCNVIVHDNTDIGGDVKDGTDGSSVLVNGIDSASGDPNEKDRDLESVMDRVGAAETEPVTEEKVIPELDVDAANWGKQAEYDELRVQNEEKDQYCVKNVCSVEKTPASSSDPDVTIEVLHVEPNAEKVGAIDVFDVQNTVEQFVSEQQQHDHEFRFENQNKIAPSAEENKNFPTTVREAIESEFKGLDNSGKVDDLCNGDMRFEEQNKLDSDQVLECVEVEAVEYKLQQLDCRENVEKLAVGEEKAEEQNKLESNVDVKGSQELRVDAIVIVGAKLYQNGDAEEKVNAQGKLESSVDTEGLHQNDDVEQKIKAEGKLELPVDTGTHKNGDVEQEVGAKGKLESSTDVEEGPKSDVIVSADEESEADKELETRKMVLEDPMGNLGEMDTNSVNNTQQEIDAARDSDRSRESIQNFPSEGKVPELDTIDDSAEDNKNVLVSNGSVRNAESLPLSPDDLNSVAEVGNTSIASFESLPTGPIDHVESEVGNDTALCSQCIPTCSVDDTRSETEAKFSIESSRSLHTCPVADSKAESELGNDHVNGCESISKCPANDVKSETGIIHGYSGSDGALPTCTVDEVRVDSQTVGMVAENAISLSTCHVTDLEKESDVMNSSVESTSSLPTCSVGDMKLESVVKNVPAACSISVPITHAAKSESQVLTSSIENGKNDMVNFESEGDQSTGKERDDKPICEEAEGSEVVIRAVTLSTSPESSTADALDVQNVDTDVGKEMFRFLIRIPRYFDDAMREQIRLAQLQVDERTQNRDGRRSAIQIKRATCSELRKHLDDAKNEERTARDVLTSKRREMDSVLSLINKMKNATSIEEIDGRIHDMEHMIEHETLPLKEEKQFIREIKQLKNHREQLSSSMGGKHELQQAFNQRGETEERFKILKKEFDSLRDEVLRTEQITKSCKKKYFDENENLRELQSQFKAADDLRQEAYAKLQNLRKEFYEKNKYFRMYRDDVRAANDYASSGDRMALHRLCVNQVETIMELWNKNDEFRNEYVRCNERSTLRRLRTLDGRSLGPDEEPPALSNIVDDTDDNAIQNSAKLSSVLPVSTWEQGKPVLPVRPKEADAKPAVKLDQRDQVSTPNHRARPTTLENGLVSGSDRDKIEENKEENHNKTKEEEGLARKAEELRKEEAAAKLKEERRLEEMNKAKEAEERKRRNAEKARVRAELRAQKEAELRQKEKEKRARKKERKKAAAEEAVNCGEGESAPATENSPSEMMEESEIKEKPISAVKKPANQSAWAKQTKARPLPMPLRNRGKRRMQPWMWVILSAVLVCVLFLMLPNFGF